MTSCSIILIGARDGLCGIATPSDERSNLAGCSPGRCAARSFLSTNFAAGLCAWAISWSHNLFRPHCDCGYNCGSCFLNQPFIFAAWNDTEAIRPCVFPTSAEALRIEFPNSDVRFAGLCEGLPRHLAIRCEGHCEFGAARRGSVKRLAVEKCCLNVVRSHRLLSEGRTRDLD